MLQQTAAQSHHDATRARTPARAHCRSSASASTVPRRVAVQGSVRPKSAPRHHESSSRNWTKDQLLELRRQTRDGSYPQSRAAAPVFTPRARAATSRNGTPRPSQPSTPRLSSQASTPRVLTPSTRDRFERVPSFDVGRWLLKRHGSLQAAFEAVDVDRDGRVSAKDLVDELLRAPAASVPSVDSLHLDVIAHELDKRWQGCASFAEFQAALEEGHDCQVWSKAQVCRGEQVEVHYRLGSSLTQGNSFRPWSALRPVLALVPANFRTRRPQEIVAAAMILEQIYVSRPSGVVLATVPKDCGMGAFEWQLFDSISGGRQLGASFAVTIHEVTLPPPDGLRASGSPDAKEQPLVGWRPPAGVQSGDVVRYEPEAKRAGDAADAVAHHTSDSGPREWSAAIHVCTGAADPRPPCDVSVSCAAAPGCDATTSCLRVSWSPIEVDGGPSCAGYKVHWRHGTAGNVPCRERVLQGGVHCLRVSADVTECLLRDLRGNAEYLVWVVTCSAVGESAPSVPLVAWTSPTLPGRVAPPEIESRPDRCTVNLAWEAPDDDGGLPISHYEIRAFISQGVGSRTSTKGADPHIVCRTSDAVRRHRFVDLRVGCSYKFQVRAVGALGPGSWSQDGAVVQTDAVPPQAPGRPDISVMGSDSCEVSWVRPTDDGGAQVTRYVIQATPHERHSGLETVKFTLEAQASGIVSETGSWNERQIVRGLRPDTSYSFKVHAVNAAGAGSWSDVSIMVRTGPPPPGAPTRLRLKRNGAYSVVLCWAPPSTGDTVVRYKVVAAVARDSGQRGAESLHEYETPDSKPRLEVPVRPSTRYVFRVAAMGSRGWGCKGGPATQISALSPACEVLTSAAPPGPPGKPIVSDVMRTEAAVAWTAASLDERSKPIERHELLVFELQIGCGDRESAQFVGAYDTRDARPGHIVRNLRARSKYFVQVRAVLEDGVLGELSEASEVFETSVTAPSPPGVPVAKDAGMPTRITLSWYHADLVPEGKPSSAVAQYVIHVRRMVGEQQNSQLGVVSEAMEWEIATGSSRQNHTVTGLSAGASYEFRVRAVTATGISSPSSRPSEVYCTGPRPPSAPGKPWFCGNLAAPPHDPILAFALPQDVGGAPIDRFRCIAFAQGRPEATCEVPLHVINIDGDVVKAAAVGAMGDEYQFAVQACNTGGWGPVGPSAAPVVEWHPRAPGRPLVAIVPGEETVQLTWEGCQDQSGAFIAAYLVHVRCTSVDCDAEGTRWTCPVTASRFGEGDASGNFVTRATLLASSLQQGHRFVFAVQAADGNEPWPISEESEEFELPISAPHAPGRPSARVMRSVETDGRVSLTARVEWTPGLTNGQPVFGYRLHIYEISHKALEFIGGNLDFEMPLAPPWVDSVSVRGVAALRQPLSTSATAAPGGTVHGSCSVLPGKTYCFEVQSVTDVGRSPHSRRSELIHAPFVQPSVCRGAVARVVESDSTDGLGKECGVAAMGSATRIRVAWQPPVENGGTQITAYEVTSTPRFANLSGVAVADLNAEPSQSLVVAARDCYGGSPATGDWATCELTCGFKVGQEHAINVRAINAVGKGPYADSPAAVRIRDEMPLSITASQQVLEPTPVLTESPRERVAPPEDTPEATALPATDPEMTQACGGDL